jgi:arabinogalactan oligomer / maltooligosaccharide transport system substrate-binding protein
MKKTVLFSMAVLVILSMVLSACAPAATPATQPPATKPTEVATVPPTEVPTEVPTVVPPPAPVKLTMWTKEGSTQLDLVKAIVADFVKANPDISIDVVDYQTEKLRENFPTAELAGTGPDLLWTVNDHAGPFTTADLIQPIDSLGIDLEQFVPGALEPVLLNGQHWGIPLSYGNNLMLLYNKKLIDKAPADTDEMVKMAKDFMAKNPDKFGLAFNFAEPFWLVPWLGGYDGKVFADDGKTPTLDTEAMVKALTLVSNFKNVDKITPKECDYACADSLFKDGMAAMIINGDWSLGDYAGSGATVTATQNIDLGTAPYPKITGADFPKPYTAGIYIMFPKVLAPDKLAATLKLTNYFISDEVQMRWLTEQKRLPSVQKLFDDPSIKSDPILAGSAADLLNGTGMPAAVEMRCNWDAMKPNLSDVLTGKATPEDAAKAMQIAAEKCVADLK